MRRGLIKARPFNPKIDEETDEDILSFQQLKIKQMTFTAGEPGLLPSTQPNLEEMLMDELREKADIDNIKVSDPENQDHQVPLEDAIELGLVSLAKDSFDLGSSKKSSTPNGMDGHSEDEKASREKANKLSLTEACMAGYIAPADLKQILQAYEDHSLIQPINEGLFDPETGLVTDPNTGKMLTLKAAVEAGIIDPDMTFFFDLATNKVSWRSTLPNKLFFFW